MADDTSGAADRAELQKRVEMTELLLANMSSKGQSDFWT
jgi:hypothetical protein